MLQIFRFRKRLILFLFSAILFNGFIMEATAQNEPPPFVRQTVRAIENMLFAQGDASIESFIIEFMADSKKDDRTNLLNKLRTMRKEVGNLQDGISVEPAANGFKLSLSANGKERTIAVKLDMEKQQVTNIQLEAPVKPMVLTNENLRTVFNQLEKDGFAGLVYIKKNGKLLLQHPFGIANESLQTKNNQQTVFGIGSRPIDFTIAAIYLLDQQSKLKLTDSISRYFENVPKDKEGITLNHLLKGQSGLPDFFHTEDDWDPDLQWVSRETAVQRMMQQTLLFKPGTEREHSHGAFGLLAALVEKVSGLSYYAFIRKHFLDPAGMKRTGEYGETRGLKINDFAAGGGPMFFGLPNIPPNWGKTSWLVRGSGGMYSTLSDLQQFYTYVRSGKVLDEEHSKIFRREAISLDGSDRGFELFSISKINGDEVYLFLNKLKSRSTFRQLIKAIEKFVEE